MLLFTQQISSRSGRGSSFCAATARASGARAIGEAARLADGEASRTRAEDPVVRELLADHPLIEQCKELNARGQLPIVLDPMLENEIDRSASRVQREHLRALIQNLKALGSQSPDPADRLGPDAGLRRDERAEPARAVGQ